MRHITITYHMNDGFDVGESCITLPFDDDHAEALLHGYALDKDPGGTLDVLMHKVAILQGCHFEGIVSIEEEQA